MKKLSYKTHKKTHKLIIFVSVVTVALVIGITAYIHAKNTPLPTEISEFVAKYPEASEYADNYYIYHSWNFKIDIQDDIDTEAIPLFIQWDKRWGYKNYGANYIGVAGCGPTCLSMVAAGLTDNPEYTPLFVAQMSDQSGYYIYGRGTSWALMTEGAQELGLTVESGTISSSYILEHLSTESPMICSVGPGDFTYTGHFIVLTGIDDSGNLIVNDPNSPSNSSKTWSVDTIVNQAKAIWVYSYSQ